MKRRSFLGRLAAAFGLGAAGSAASHADPPPRQAGDVRARMADQARQQADEALKTFPFPVTVVHGRDALATFERLKARRAGTPVVLGGDQSFARMAEGLQDPFEPPGGPDSPKAIIAKAATYQSLDKALSASQSELREALKRAMAEQIKSMPPAQREQAEKLEASLDQEEDVEPDPGEWPQEPAPVNPVLLSARNILGGDWFERVYIATLPTADPTEAPALLRWGSWNDCPAAEVHVKALRQWRDLYGAELVAISGDVLELRVSRGPKTKEEALKLARELYRYCPDSVDQGTGSLAPLAAIFMRSSWWQFWWD